MKKYENECVGCVDVGLPCYGSRCPNRRVKRLYCDQCREETEKLYIYDDMELCRDCLLEAVPVVGRWEEEDEN